MTDADHELDLQQTYTLTGLELLRLGAFVVSSYRKSLDIREWDEGRALGDIEACYRECRTNRAVGPHLIRFATRENLNVVAPMFDDFDASMESPPA